MQLCIKNNCCKCTAFYFKYDRNLKARTFAFFFFTAVKINVSVRNVGFYIDRNDRFSLPFIHTLYFHIWVLKKLLLSGGTCLAL